MTLQNEIKKIRTGDLAPIYLVLGEESYLSEIFKKELSKKIIQDEDDELNFANFDMNEVTLSNAVEEASTIPFFGDYRLVNIENPYFLTGEKRVGGLDHNTDELLAYLENPSETTVLVFYALYPKLDERKKIVKQLKKKATLIDIGEMKEQDVRKYGKEYIQNEGYEITPEAFDLLLRLTDMELSKMMREMNKLLLFASDSKKITKLMVEDLVPKSLEHNIFDMTNYVMAGNAEKALTLYHDLILQGEETIKINAILISQVRLLLHTKIMGEMGYQQSNMADVIKVHPYRIKLAVQQSRNYEKKMLIDMLDELVENDYRIKTGEMDKELIFELFVLKYGQTIRQN